ncbi:MAG: amino acid adenylation domain-containing protein, partial [Cyclobacteriaceae bacterium]
DMTFNEFVQQVQQGNSLDLDHQLYPYEDLVDSLNLERDTSRNALFDVFFTFQRKQDLSIFDLSKFTVEPYSIDYKVSKFDLTLVVAEDDSDIQIRLEYASTLFKQKTAEKFMSYLMEIISMVTANSTTKISDINILEEKERKLLSSFSPAPSAFPENSTIVDIFERQVSLTPLSTAVMFNSSNYSYKALNQKANQLARYLQKTHAITKGEIVGVLLPKSDSALISILAILKLGAAYLPIDTNYPVERTNYIIENSGLRVMITKEGDFNLVKAKHLIDYDLIEFDKERKENLNINILPNDLAYVIYTSGSTGYPKGVMIEHGSNVNMSTDQVKLFDITDLDNILWMAAVAFDASVSEIMLALYSGATLVIPDDDTIKDTVRLCSLIAETKTTVITFTPGYLELLPIESLRSLRCIITAGEAAYAGKAFEVIKNGIRYFNAYGPTECAVCVSTFEVLTEDYLQTNIPIGRPIANTQIIILDRDLNPVPIGCKGTIYVSGKGVARGYLNNPDLTKKSFITLPNGNTQRFYNTGDLGEWTPDGVLLFHGRKDNQIKLRGFRIELGEIEGVLSSIKGVRNSCVVVHQGKGRKKELVGFVVPESNLDNAFLQKELSKRLPENMVPRLWVELERLPLTINGKIDKRALLQYDWNCNDEFIAPKGDTEEKLVEIWSEILQCEEDSISVETNFFDLGGNSIAAMQITTAINKNYGIQLELQEIFRLKTIRELSNLIDLDIWIGDEEKEKSRFEEVII